MAAKTKKTKRTRRPKVHRDTSIVHKARNDAQLLAAKMNRDSSEDKPWNIAKEKRFNSADRVKKRAVYFKKLGSVVA